MSAEKFRAVLDWWDADDPAPEPLPYLRPVEDIGLSPGTVESGRVVLADGHTRALAAVLSGTETLPVVRDPDLEDLSMGLYRECVSWCVDADVRRPADLVGRVVSAETHQQEWVQRCHSFDVS
ncbi:MAG: histone acetyltransferase [Halolamina sp.]